jgi:hypothetical protein
MMLVLAGALIALSVLTAVAAVAMTAQVSAGPTIIGIACLLAIFARILQAAAYQAQPPRARQDAPRP